MSNDIRSGTGAGGALDRATDGYDDPNRGPLDRAANAVTGSSGGVGGMMDRALDGRDDPNRGPLDSAANALTGGSGGVSGATHHGSTGIGATATYAGAGAASGGVISAVFDSDTAARSAVADLRSAGLDDSAVSLVTQRRGTTTTANADGDVVDEEHTNYLRGIFGGGALGAGLGVAALAIPGVGPLVAAGAIAASAVPGAMALGAAVGAAGGAVNEGLKSHGISDEDASYYTPHMKSGGILLTVHPEQGRLSTQMIRDIIMRNGGHNAASPRA